MKRAAPVGESRFKLAADCDHFYCADCIRGSLGAMMDTGQFPAYCPACRADARGDAERLRAGPGRITDATLTFLQRRRVFDKSFQFRFMLQVFIAGQQKRAKFQTSKPHNIISAVFRSFWLIFGRAIISRSDLEA